MYNSPPSLLFATVDKFAQLAWVKKSSLFFGTDKVLPPDLIIQDELHLLSGPLGTMTALFEGIVEMLCQKRGVKPKIIASTATIKNADMQVSALFGNREVATFPAPGLDYGDNFFAKIDLDNKNREYVGIIPTGKTVTTTQLNILALLLFGRILIAQQHNQDVDLDNYWTIVSYYNSLRELGRMYSKTRDEVSQLYKIFLDREFPNGHKYYLRNPKELTSRISGHDIRKALQSIEKRSLRSNNPFDLSEDSSDLVFATNMISVGLDIKRLNLILMNGQPNNVSEYIQVTSRISRKYPGLVLTLFNPFKVRDKSYFENFSSFHKQYYKFIEPISITPYTRVAIRKMLPTLLAAYLNALKDIIYLSDVTDSVFDDFREFLKNRINDEALFHFMERKIDEHMDALNDAKRIKNDLTLFDFLRQAGDFESQGLEGSDWLVMNSMREISPNAVIKATLSKPERIRARRNDYE